MRGLYLTLFFLFMMYSAALGQQDNVVKFGSAQGVLIDSASGKGLPSGTVAVYKIQDSTLVSFQLSAGNGGFLFSQLPASVPLKLVVSFVGYEKYIKQFTLEPLQAYKFGRIHMNRNSISLNEVSIASYQPPVEMNGDTLEFNAAAFTMDKNAVVEDLLRKLPGVTVWGDGKITVFGKTVNNVLVNGKPFFGQDGTIATQNLPKNAVEKVQVYTDKSNPRTQYDSTLSVNLKLKKDKSRGYFGKIGAGYGTGKRYASDGMLSAFNPRSQLSIVEAFNNINITPTDITALMRNSSFKGVGVNIEYQPNFDVEGIHKSVSAGLNFQHDFIADPGPMKNNRIDGSYFLTDQTNDMVKNTTTKINLTDDRYFLSTSASALKGRYRNQLFTGNYGRRNESGEYYLSPQLAINDVNSSSEQDGKVTNEKGELQSTSINSYHQDRNSRDLTIKAGMNNAPSRLKVDYIFTNSNVHDQQLNTTLFYSPLDGTQQLFYNRRYNNRVSQTANEANLKYGLSKSVFWEIGLDLLNDFKWEVRKDNNVVSDLDTLLHSYRPNTYLTNELRNTKIDEKPGFSFYRRFTKTFTNRYRKSWWLTATGQGQFFKQENEASKPVQAFNRSYTVFVPSASIYFENEQISDHRTSYTLKYLKKADFPTVDQLVPLVDSANVYYQRIGNLRLHEAITHQVSLSINYFSLRSNKLFDNYTFNISAGKVKDAFVDSVLYQSSGQTVAYTVNRNSATFFRVDGDFYRAVKFERHQFQLVGKGFAIADRRPRYVNEVLIKSSTLMGQGSLSLLYTYKDFVAFSVARSINYFSASQTGGSGSMYSSVNKTTFSSSINLPAKLTLSSNISFNRSTASYLQARDFKIWNATLAWRMLQGNQGEVKFAAMDLLHQNSGILSTGSFNTVTNGTVNVLQQYFMLTLSWFPRKFGKKEKEASLNK